MNSQAQLLRTRTAFYPRDRRSARRAREFTRTALADWSAAQRLDDVLLCVSELSTNALLHGVPPTRGFRLCLALAEDGALRVEVHDSGPGDVPAPARPSDPDSEAGRGLLLVAALADDWGVGERNPGKVVWCEFRGCRLS